MGRYGATRAIEAIVLIIGLSFTTYLLIGLMPGDPIDLMIAGNPAMTSADAARLRALEGLDQPILMRWLSWASRALSGDFGFSRVHAQPALLVVGERIGPSALLLGASLVLSLVIAVPLGVIAARQPGGTVDTVVAILSFAGISVPPFWLALLLILGFAVALGWFPAGGPPPTGAPLGEALRHVALPVAALTLASVGSYVRFVRAAMIEVLSADWVRTARAVGMSRARIVWQHGLRAAAIPLVTLLALKLGTLVSGALITETVFGWPGMGKMVYDAILGNDFNLALVGLLISAALTIVFNLAADVTYAALDPRVTLR